MLSLSFDRHFLSSRFHYLLGFLSQRSLDLRIPYIMPPQINLFPLMNLKAMLLLESLKCQCILVDPRKHRILDILPDRAQSYLADYWRGIPRNERLKVKFFVCDMWLPYEDLKYSITNGVTEGYFIVHSKTAYSRMNH